MVGCKNVLATFKITTAKIARGIGTHNARHPRRPFDFDNCLLRWTEKMSQMYTTLNNTLLVFVRTSHTFDCACPLKEPHTSILAQVWNVILWRATPKEILVRPLLIAVQKPSCSAFTTIQWSPTYCLLHTLATDRKLWCLGGVLKTSEYL